ncbi:Uncharacterised protein [Citrobacter freundii]|nr:Uncharacterised protein [Citrobacter freundii]
MREATATWIRPQHEVPAKWIQNSAIPISNTAAIDVVACGTMKVKAAEQNIPAIIQILRLLIGAIPPFTSQSVTKPLTNMPAAPKQKWDRRH